MLWGSISSHCQLWVHKQHYHFFTAHECLFPQQAITLHSTAALYCKHSPWPQYYSSVFLEVWKKKHLHFPHWTSKWKISNPWILTQKLLPNSFRLLLLANIYNNAIWKPNYHQTGNFITEEFYSTIAKVLRSVTSCLAKFFSFNGNFQSMKVTLVKWQQSDMASSIFFY